VVLLFAKLVFVRLNVPNGPPPELMMWLRPIVSAVGWLILAKAAVGFIAGWGLLQRDERAWVTALVIGFVALLSVPIGTALGIYTLWVLLPSQSEEEYKALAQAHEGSQRPTAQAGRLAAHIAETADVNQNARALPAKSSN